MFAVVAFACFLLALLKLEAPFDWAVLGLLFVALHLAVSAWPLWPVRRS